MKVPEPLSFVVNRSLESSWAQWHMPVNPELEAWEVDFVEFSIALATYLDSIFKDN